MTRSGAALLAAVAAVSAATALVARDSLAEKGFVMAMEESQRREWEKDFNGLLTRPFKNLECATDAKLDLALGKGCVDAGKEVICCRAWTIKLACEEQRWKQTAIESDGCERKPAAP